MTSGIHVAVVDRYLAFADTLALELRDQDDVVEATASTSTESLWQLLERPCADPRVGPRVDVVLLDSDLLDPGLQVLQRIQDEHPTTRIVVLSNEADPAQVVQALTSGAHGWLPKTLPLAELQQCLRAVANGETWVPGRLLTTVLRAMIAAREEAEAPASLLRPLTARERQILQCLVDGLSRPQIAERLGMSPNTVRTHVHNVLHKLGAHSSLRAVAIAREAGLATADSKPAPPTKESRHSKG
ncbi:MAG TPA: response regulator transcription factor [Nocardioidaceae bacterium]|nr:response regulator transcription factor [Nocardioidaceae bacterium]